MRGSTLLETLIYITLLSILMIGVFSSVFVLIDTEKSDTVEKDSVLINKKLYE